MWIREEVMSTRDKILTYVLSIPLLLLAIYKWIEALAINPGFFDESSVVFITSIALHEPLHALAIRIRGYNYKFIVKWHVFKVIPIGQIDRKTILVIFLLPQVLTAILFLATLIDWKWLSILLGYISVSSGDIIGALDVLIRKIEKVRYEENGELFAYLLIKN